MNITEIWTHPRFKTADMLMRRSIRMEEETQADRVADALKEADGIPREVVTELDRLMELTDEDLFGGAA